jgi:hypothetical protein
MYLSEETLQMYHPAVFEDTLLIRLWNQSLFLDVDDDSDWTVSFKAVFLAKPKVPTVIRTNTILSIIYES